MMLPKITISVVLALISTALLLPSADAHFQLTFPPARGTNEDLEPNAPCGGFNSVGVRTPYPLKSAPITLTAFHGKAAMNAFISFSSAPASNADFLNSTTNATAAPLKLPFKMEEPGNLCFSVDLSRYPQAVAGANATIQVTYDAGDGLLYQCGDVTFSTTASTSGAKCTNSSTNAPGHNDSDHNSTATPAKTGGAGSHTVGASTAVFIALMASLAGTALHVL